MESFLGTIPQPSYRQTQNLICIEMLYTDEVLRLKHSRGKRIYLKSEFDEESGYHLKEDVHCIHPKRQSLVVEDVFRGTEKVSLSKTEFANMIRERQSPYESVSFEGFKSILETLDRIQQDWKLSRK